MWLGGCGLLLPIRGDDQHPRLDASSRDAGRPLDSGTGDAGGRDAGAVPSGLPVVVGVSLAANTGMEVPLPNDPRVMPWPVHQIQFVCSEPMGVLTVAVDAEPGPVVETPNVIRMPSVGATGVVHLTRMVAESWGDGRFCVRFGGSSERGAALDGEWGGSFPSGDGREGGDFAYALDVLHGDVSGDGIVDAADRELILALQTTADPFADVNGDGVVDGQDVDVWQTLEGRVLPPRRSACP